MCNPMGQRIGLAGARSRYDEEGRSARGDVCAAVFDGAALLRIKRGEVRFRHLSTESIGQSSKNIFFARATARNKEVGLKPPCHGSRARWVDFGQRHGRSPHISSSRATKGGISACPAYRSNCVKQQILGSVRLERAMAFEGLREPLPVRRCARRIAWQDVPDAR